MAACPATRRGPAGPLGLILPTLPQEGGTLPTARSLGQLCRGAEQAGASGLWACDHVFWHGPVVECMTSLTVAAAATDQATVGPCVLQLPLRDRVLAAKQAASLHHLSGGRVVLGLGVGSHPGEYEAAGAAYHRRGHQLDQDVATLRALWARGVDDIAGTDEKPPLGGGGPVAGTGDRGRLDSESGAGAIESPGPYHQLPAGVDIPIWFGGSSAASRARTAAVGDGWLPLFVSPDHYPEALADIHHRCEGQGRDPASVVPAMVAFVSVAASAASVDAAMTRGTQWMSSLYRIPARAFARHLVSGTARECASALTRWMEGGATHLAVFVTSDDPLVQFQELSGELHHVLGRPRTPASAPTLVPT